MERQQNKTRFYYFAVRGTASRCRMICRQLQAGGRECRSAEYSGTLIAGLLQQKEMVVFRL